MVVLLGVGPTLVICAGARIGADHQKVLAGGKTLMAGASRKDHNVAGAEFKCATGVAAKPNFGAAARDPKHLVNARVIVQIVVDAIAPAVAPAVVLEQVLH